MGAVAVRADLDVAVWEEVVPQMVGKLHRVLQIADLVGVDVDHQQGQAGLALPCPPAREIDRLGLDDDLALDAELSGHALEMAEDEALGEAVEPDARRSSRCRFLEIAQHFLNTGYGGRRLSPRALGDDRLESLVPVGVDGAGLIGVGGQYSDAPVLADEAEEPLRRWPLLLLPTFLLLAFAAILHRSPKKSRRYLLPGMRSDDACGSWLFRYCRRLHPLFVM